MKNKNLLVTIIIIVVVAGGAFFAGMQYQKSQPRQSGNFAGGQGGFGRRFGANGGGAVAGNVLSMSGNTMTVQLADGSSKIVLISSSTSINKAAKASVSDLTTGLRIAAFGTANSDGSVTAQSIQINPVMRTGGANPSRTPSAQ